MHGWLAAVLQNLGLGGSPVATAVTAALQGLGWYASDDGLLFGWRGPRDLFPGEARAAGVDFTATAELRAGDTIASASVAVTPTTGLDASPGLVAGARVRSTLSPGSAGAYQVSFRATTAAGAVFVRTVTVRVPDLGTVTFPAPTSPGNALPAGPGWYASDDGLVPTRSAWHGATAGETRRLWMDFGACAEAVAGDALTGPPAVGFSPAGPSVRDVAVAGTRVLATVTGLAADTQYLTVWRVATAGGSILARPGGLATGGLAVASFTFPTPGSGPVPPAAGGWYASDDGLVVTQAAPHRKSPGSRRRYWVDFAALSEVVAGDTLAAGRIGFSPAGPTLDDVAVAGTRLSGTIAGGAAGTEYAVCFEGTFAAGGVVARVPRLLVEDVG